jgi:hypothetical protein
LLLHDAPAADESFQHVNSLGFYKFSAAQRVGSSCQCFLLFAALFASPTLARFFASRTKTSGGNPNATS